MLQPWFGDRDVRNLPEHELGVFTRQQERWKKFRWWQIDNRGLDADDGYETFREERRRYFRSTGLSEIADRPGFEHSVENQWRQEQYAHEMQRHTLQKGCGGDFDEYIKAAHHHLKDHGFFQPFEFDRDPKRQDQLATWIEYLVFEYWWLDNYTRSVRRLQGKHDAAWEELVGFGVLRDFETKDYLLNADAQCQRETEESRVMEAHRLLRRSWDWRSAARVTDFKSVARREKLIQEFIEKTQQWRIVKADEARQQLRIKRILSQMSLVEEEVKASATKPAMTIGKRKRQDDAEAVDKLKTHEIKRQKQDDKDDAQHVAERKVAPRKTRLTLGLEAPVINTRVEDQDRRQRSARIKMRDKRKAIISKRLSVGELSNSYFF